MNVLQYISSLEARTLQAHYVVCGTYKIAMHRLLKPKMYKMIIQLCNSVIKQLYDGGTKII